jgi:polysaccharide biosynthesis transport protein
MQFSLDPRDMLRLLWRRKWFVVVPAALCTIGAFSTIALLPTLYESEATLLIEQQEIPEDVVQPLVSDVIERRLEVLTRRILTKDKLLEIANRFDLYEDERDKLSNGALAGRVRSRIETEILFAPITDGQGRTSRTALAFQIRFSDHDPAVAQGVTHDLVSAYVSSNIEDRRAVAQQATGFFAEERQKLQERIASIEAEFTEFKKDNREALPEEITFKRQQLTSIEQQLRNLNGRFRSLREQQSFLETQIALTNEFEERNARFNREAPEARLQAARSELAAAEARYRSGHPDVIRLRREVTALEAVVGERSGSSALAEQEALLSAELASLRERYTTEHPDVRRMQRKLGAVQIERASCRERV